MNVDTLPRPDVVASSHHPTLKHVMLIADDAKPAEDRQIGLLKEGYQVSTVLDGVRGLLLARRVEPDLIVVNWSPPGVSGIDICRRLKAACYQRYIILITEDNLTREQSAEQRMLGFQSGANDCLSPPFTRAELFARIGANIRWQNSHEQAKISILRYADLQLNRSTREVFRGRYLINLTVKEFDLLAYLMAHPSQVLTRAQILRNVWNQDYTGSSNIVEVYVRYLRKKLNRWQGDCLIQTVRGVGYILREPARSLKPLTQ